MTQQGMLKKQDFVSVKIQNDHIKEAVIIRAEITEIISKLFEIEVFLQTKQQIDTSNLLNTPASVTLEIDDKSKRIFDGIIESASFENQLSIVLSEDKITDNILRIKIVPPLARLLYSRKYRVFQELQPKEIIQQILKENNLSDFKITMNSTETDKRTFCVQYGESDFHFISRLMEETGAFYSFENEGGKSTLHISDNSLSAKKLPTEFKIRKSSTNLTISPLDVYNVSFSRSLGTKKIDYFAYNETQANVVNSAASSASAKSQIGEKEFYDNFFTEKTAGDELSKTMLESENAITNKLTGAGYAPFMAPGLRCSISGSTTKEHDGDFFIISVKHVINQLPEEVDTPIYHNNFEAIPADVPFRPVHQHQKNRIFGCQTAVVTGTSGEEIFNDENARVKVKFHWDSKGTSDEKSSCWIRVAQVWSGNSFGALVIPRVGMEVLVTFINGDPDQPLITGCVYNGVNKPPANYAKEKNTISTFHTNSSKAGQDGGSKFNELRFNDKTDEEEIFIHAQKDMNSIIENSKTETLNEGSKTVVLESKKDPVKHELTIKKGDKTTTINEGNCDIVLDKGSQTITLKNGDQTVILSKGDRSLTLQDGNQTIKLSNGNLVIDVSGNINIKATKNVTIEAGGAISIKSTGATSVESDDEMDIKVTKGFKLQAQEGEMKFKTSYAMSCMNGKIESKQALSFKGLDIKAMATTSLKISSDVSAEISSKMLDVKAIATKIGGGTVKLG